MLTGVSYVPCRLSFACSLQGGMVLVSHDFRLIDQVAKEIWVCEKQVRLSASLGLEPCCSFVCVCG
jgi:hypothetical protein